MLRPYKSAIEVANYSPMAHSLMNEV
jgi:hypothetical protein